MQTKRAFAGRFEEDKAVLLLGENEEEQTILPRAWLPKEAVEGTLLRGDRPRAGAAFDPPAGAQQHETG